MDRNTFEWFEHHNRRRELTLGALTAYCAALHARVTSPLPLAMQDALARKADQS